MKRWACAVVAAGFVFSLIGAPTVAAPIINVGDHELLPNTPGQTIVISVSSGGDRVQGLNFNAQIADGGAEAGGTTDGPNITDANIVLGTIFTGNNTGQQDPGSAPQVAIRTTTTSTGTVGADGILATLTIDTTGFMSGNWDLKLLGTANGDTDFAGVAATIANGSISILVPEPGTLTTLALVAPLALARRRRRN